MRVFGSNFSRLIARYAGSELETVYLVTRAAKGEYDETGTYIPAGAVKCPIRAAVTSLTDKKIYEAGGRLTSRDKRMYTDTPISTPLEETQVEYKGVLYNIEVAMDYSDYAEGVGIFNLTSVAPLTQGGTTP